MQRPTKIPGRQLRPWILVSLGLAAALGCHGCSPAAGDRVEITASRVFSEVDAAARIGATTAERFDWVLPKPQQEAENPFQWSVPEGWKEVASTGALRAVNMRFGENDEGECYFGVMQGDGGGLAMNVNRWRGQMGKEPSTEEEIAELPRRALFGGDAVLLDLSGEFKGMGAAEGKPDYRMLGVIQSSPAFTFFVKMTGPAALVAENESKFAEFCDSMKIGRHGQ